MPKLQLTPYKPNLKDPRVIKKIREALSFVESLRLSKKPKNIHNRKLTAIFGNTRRIGLGKYLKAKILYQVGTYKVGLQSFSYVINEDGCRDLYSLIGVNEPDDSEIATRAYGEIVGGTKEIQYLDSGTRRYHPIQNMRRDLRPVVFDSWFDYDIETAAATLISQYAKGRIEESDNLIKAIGEFDAINEYIKNKESVRKHIASIGQVSLEKAKEITNALIFQAHPAPSSKATLYQLLGGNEVTHTILLNDPFIAKMRKEIRTMWRWAQLRDKAERREKRMRGMVIAPALTSAARHRQQIYQTLERQVMDVVVQQLNNLGVRYVLMHDGFMSNTKISVQLLQDEIKRKTDFSVKFSEKQLRPAT